MSQSTNVEVDALYGLNNHDGGLPRGCEAIRVTGTTESEVCGHILMEDGGVEEDAKIRRDYLTDDLLTSEDEGRLRAEHERRGRLIFPDAPDVERGSSSSGDTGNRKRPFMLPG